MGISNQVFLEEAGFIEQSLREFSKLKFISVEEPKEVAPSATSVSIRVDDIQGRDFSMLRVRDVEGEPFLSKRVYIVRRGFDPHPAVSDAKIQGRHLTWL
jgi:hypothetical protein